jgi:hypothetical protein
VFIESGSGYESGSNISSESETESGTVSGSGPWVLMAIKNIQRKFLVYLFTDQKMLFAYP